ncbi:MAG: energy-coupled thiamine transporter ThiT [Oscillospiraceae bacterium]|nr:energy-coupled thiamine transporter ThiT [Oscillospiraceae bacterium]
MERQTRIRMLCEGAIMIALALVLGLLKVYEFPQGGSISLEMLPLLVFCVRWGVGDGLVACLAFGILQVFVQGAVSWGWISILLDYIVAFAVLGLAGLGRGHKYGIFWGSVLGCAARFIVHFISGITIYRIVAPTELLGTVFDSPLLYSAAYNGSFMAIDLALCLVIFAILYKPLGRYFVVPRQEKSRAYRGKRR